MLTPFRGTVSLALNDVRLETEQFKGIVSDDWTIWKVSDLTSLMKDVASRIDGDFMQWPEGGAARWISTLDADVRSDIERHTGHSVQCCSGCLKAAEPDGTPIDLVDHPMFENLSMCDACKSNYENDDNWSTFGDGEEECRCCGYEHPHMPLVRCDNPKCTASFCHGCINGQCPNYGSAEFRAIEESAAEANAAPWLCFLCRPHTLRAFKVNDEALQRFRTKEAAQRPSRRGSVPRSAHKARLRRDDSDDSGDDSEDEEIVFPPNASDLSSEDDENDDDGVDSDQNEKTSAAAAPSRQRSTGVGASRHRGQARIMATKRVFERTKEHFRVRSRHEPYILIENVKGMSTGDRNTIQQYLKLDMTVIDSVRFSFATRKRLYFANFDCLDESELPTLDTSPHLSTELDTVIPAQVEMMKYFDCPNIDSRFIEVESRSHNETPYNKARCILPDKGEDKLMAELNDKLRAIAMSGFDSTRVPKLNQEDVRKMKNYNMIWYKEAGIPYLQLRLLTVRENAQL